MVTKKKKAKTPKKIVGAVASKKPKKVSTKPASQEDDRQEEGEEGKLAPEGVQQPKKAETAS